MNLDKSKVLNTACLVLEWAEMDEWVCFYYLNIPVDTLDGRVNPDDRSQGFTRSKANIGSTKVVGRDVPLKDGSLYIPFRDGAHIAWDAETLSLPTYVIWGDIVQEIKEQN